MVTTDRRGAEAIGPCRSGGFLVTIDGPSGVGKTSVTGLICRQLVARGIPALGTRQPSDSAMGRLARANTQNLHGLALTFLMAADRHHHQDHVITPAIEQGRLVVCDRYVTSALVLDTLDGADPDFIWTIYRYLRWPALAILLAGDPEQCQARAATRGVYSRFHSGGIAARHHEAILYEQTARMLVDRGYPIEVVDTTDRTAQQVTNIVLARIQAVSPPAHGGGDALR